MSRRLVRAALAVLGLVCSTATPAAAAVSDPVTLPTAPGKVGFLQSAGAGPDGTVAVAYDDGNGDTLAAVRHPGGSFDIAPLATSGGVRTDLAVAPSGAVVATWTRGGGAAMWSARPRGGAFTAPVELSATPDAVFGDAAVEVVADGSALAAWLGADGAIHGASRAGADPAATFTPLAPLVPAAAVGGDPGSAVTLTAGPDGSVVLAWVTRSGPETALRVAIRRAGAAAFGTPRTIRTVGQPAGIVRPTLRFRGNGDLDAVWTEQALAFVPDPEGSGYTVPEYRSSVSGVSWRGGVWSPVSVLDDGGRQVNVPTVSDTDLVQLPDGSAHAVWSAFRGGAASVPHALRLPAAPAFDLGAPLATAQERLRSQIEPLCGGRTLLTLQRTGGLAYRILDGAFAGGAEVTVATADDVGPPAVAGDAASGTAVIAWGEYRPAPGGSRLRVAVVEEACPAPPGPGTVPPPATLPAPSRPAQQLPAQDRAAPRLTRVRLSRKTLTRGGKRAGTTVSWVASETSTVRIEVQRLTRGWRSGKRCVAARPKGGKGAKRCVRATTQVTMARQADAGMGTYAFRGTVDGKALPRGSYRFSLTAADAAGNRTAKPVLLGFTVK